MVVKLVRCIAAPGPTHRCAARAAWVALALGLVAAAAAAQPPARLLRASPEAVVFTVRLARWTLGPSTHLEAGDRLTIAGYATRGEPGEPALPVRQFLVGLPPDGGYGLSYRIVSSERLGRLRLDPVPAQEGIRDDQLGPLPTPVYRRDDAAWSRFRSPPVVEAEEPVWIRRQRVLPVLVSPVQYDAATGETVLATEIEVTVAIRGGGRVDSPRARPESPMWSGILGRLIVNAEQARAWRAPPRTELSAAPPRTPPALRQGPHVRIRVRHTGIHKVTAAALGAAGFPPGQGIADLHLFQRTYDADTHAAGIDDVAFHVEEDGAGTPGVFDSGDFLVFHARRLRDDPDRGDAVEKFSDHNVYWLGASSGPQMAQRALTAGSVTADTASASFPVLEHFQEDAHFNENIRPGLGADFYAFNEGFEADNVDMPFRMWVVRPGTNVTLRAELFGQNYQAPRLLWVGMSNSQGERVLDAAYSIPGKSKQLFTATVPAAGFDPGANAFRIRRPDNSRPAVHVLLNFVEAEYEALYRAVGDRLDFGTGALSGDTSITVTGIGDPSDLWLFDVTDPDRPVRCVLHGGLFTDVGGSFALSFRDTVGAPKRYALLPESAMREVAAADISEDTHSAIIVDPPLQPVDVLVVSQGGFVSQMGPWVAYREAQGYRVLLVDVQDVFDEFNNGVPGARAIDHFVRRFYELAGAGALVLVGDSSEDNKRVHAESGPNLVPTHSWPDYVWGLAIDEVVTTDKRYALLPGPGGVVDAYPDMIVGRLPVASANELTIVLAKTFGYERPQAHELWRRRILVFADDKYSEGASSFGGLWYCPQGETAFENGQEQSAQTMESGTGGHDVTRFYLSTYTEDFYKAGPDGCQTKLAAWNFARAEVNPPWMNELHQGASIVTIQSHMNRSQITHEAVFTTFRASRLGSSTGQDHLRVNNRDKPFVIFGMGCHFSDYALHKEQRFDRVKDNTPNGDAFAEQLLLVNNRGAVATYGSSGFEYLNQTNDIMNVLSQVWFYSAPYDTMVNQTQGRWVLGELMFLVENEVAGRQPRAVERYHILGDPLLRIDAGPPAFDVTVNGIPFTSGDLVQAGGASDTIRVVATVSDENAIDGFALTDAGAPQPGALTITPLIGQPPLARSYRVEFAHQLRPSETYDVVLTARQAPDTASGDYHMEADFIIRVETSVSVSVNGRLVENGDNVPSTGNYRVEMTFPTVIPQEDIAVAIDSIAVDNAVFSRPAPDDSTTWIVTFTRTLSDGRHVMQITSAGALVLDRLLVVSSAVGLRDVLPYPNPFVDTSHFVFTNDVVISDGTIDIFTTSGRRIRRLVIPPRARQPGQNAVSWDGRDAAGDEIANGTYLFIVTVEQRGQKSAVKGKISRLR